MRFGSVYSSSGVLYVSISIVANKDHVFVCVRVFTYTSDLLHSTHSCQLKTVTATVLINSSVPRSCQSTRI